MLLFKRIYIAPFRSNHSEKCESMIPEHERDDLIVTLHRHATGNDETIQIETLRGWCSWGF